MKSIVPRLLAGGLALAIAGVASADDGLAIVAREAHLGDGRVVHDVVVVARRGVIASIETGPAARPPAGVEVARCDVLLPGLVAALVVPQEALDTPSEEPDRLAVDLADATTAGRWLDAGVTALALAPGRRRLVSGRGGVVRLTGDAELTTHLRRGALCATLESLALDPPLRFEPVLRPNVDRPLLPAAPQRPFTTMAAAAELRRVLAERAPDDRDVPVRIAATREADVRRAIDLAREAGARLVVEGGAEAWKVARELAATGAMVALDVPDPTRPVVRDADVETRADAAAVLVAAGVEVALAAREWSDVPDPLLVAASAVRQGLPRELALAAITGRAARAMGASDVGVLEVGAVADLVGFDRPPLAAGASPVLVASGGVILRNRTVLGQVRRDDERPLVLRAGRVLTGEPGVTLRQSGVLVRDGRIASVGGSLAVAAGARVLDFGDAAVIVPGLVDAWSRAGLEPGPPAAAGARTRAIDAIEPTDGSLRSALEAGVTSAVVAPHARGPVAGSAAVVATAGSLHEDPDHAHDGDEPRLLATHSADAGIVFVLDDGERDEAPRAPRLKALRELLGKAKAYADARKPKDEKPAKKRRAVKAVEKPKEPEDDLSLEPLRALFAGKAKAWLRASREESIVAGLDAFKDVGLTPVLVGGEEADRIAKDLATRGVTVVLGPDVTRREDGRLVNVAVELRAAGVPVALGSFEPGGSELLPLAAAAAVRQGLSPEDALAALTTTAAASAGMEGELGRIAPGRRADLVAFDGDPFEATSRVLAVVSDGHVEWERP